MSIAPIEAEQPDRFGADLADRLAMALRHTGIGVQEMADALEVSRSAVGSWINGRNRPRSRDLRAFALRTGYPVDWFLKGECAPRDLNPEPTDTWRISLAPLIPLRPRFAMGAAA